MRMVRAILFATGVVSASLGVWHIIAAQQPSEAPARGAAAPARGKDGTLVVDPKQARQFGIGLTPAVAATDAILATLPAIIAPPQNARQAVAAPLPGVVTRTLVVEGDSVRRGQALAIVASRDVLNLGGELSRARARLEVAQSNARRLSQLNREGIIAGARAEEALAMAAEARANVAEKSRILRLVNGHGGSGTYTLVAPIAGRVTGARIQIGSPVDGTTAPYVIDAVDRYEVQAQLPERLVGSVRPGMGVRLGALRGVVTAVGSTIDPATRSAALKAALPAGSGVVAGGATSVVLFGPAPAGSVTVPAAAVTNLHGHDVVFVSTGHGYETRKVVAGATNDGATVILSGVRPSEQVVSSGISALKALAQAK